MENSIVVSICMITYGHEKFIEQAINGVLMQETNFEIELIISNDCSPDATDSVIQSILKTHPRASVIKYINHKENIGMTPNFVSAIKQCNGKYIAFCEGDDYWTDPLKLQKQVDFLEANEDYSICWTKYLVKNEGNSQCEFEQPDWIDYVEKGKDISFDLNNIFKPYCTYTLTVMFKVDGFDFQLLNKLKFLRDNTIYAIALTKGKGMLINFYSAVYRIHDGGIHSKASPFLQRYNSYLNLKEITEKIDGCNTSNLIRIRNILLRESFRLYPNQKSHGYFELVIDTFRFLGLKEFLVLLREKCYYKIIQTRSSSFIQNLSRVISKK